MTARPLPSAPGAGDAITLAIWRTLHSPEWARACADDYERTWLLARAVCDALFELGIARVPSGARWQALLLRARRDRDICAAFDGRNYAELAARHGLSSRTVRRIIERCRRRNRGE